MGCGILQAVRRAIEDTVFSRAPVPAVSEQVQEQPQLVSQSPRGPPSQAAAQENGHRNRELVFVHDCRSESLRLL